jgi:hypothetical protein
MDWAAKFKEREPEHYVFPSEKIGQNGSPYGVNCWKIGSSGRTRTYNPLVNRTINNVLSMTYAERLAA